MIIIQTRYSKNLMVDILSVKTDDSKSLKASDSAHSTLLCPRPQPLHCINNINETVSWNEENLPNWSYMSIKQQD